MLFYSDALVKTVNRDDIHITVRFLFMIQKARFLFTCISLCCGRTCRKSLLHVQHWFLKTKAIMGRALYYHARF